MISYKNQLLVVGGYYEEIPSSRQSEAGYESEYTNEVHYYNLTTGKRDRHIE